jgi:hypothetical protein
MIASLPKDLNEKESDLLVRHGLNAGYLIALNMSSVESMPFAR